MAEYLRTPQSFRKGFKNPVAEREPEFDIQQVRLITYQNP
jgi:hypothetical protein